MMSLTTCILGNVNKTSPTPDDGRLDLGQFIDQRRGELGYSLKDLADATNGEISLGSICSLQRRKRSIKSANSRTTGIEQRTIAALSRALQCDPSLIIAADEVYRGIKGRHDYASTPLLAALAPYGACLLYTSDAADE